MERLSSNWADCYVTWYLSNFPKSVNKVHLSLNSDKNNGYFTWRPTCIFDHISLNSSYNEKCFRQNLYKKSQHKFNVQYLFSESRTFCEIMRKNIADPVRPHVTIWRMRIACWKPKANNILSEYVILITFRCKNGCMNAPQCNVKLTLPVLFYCVLIDLTANSVYFPMQKGLICAYDKCVLFWLQGRSYNLC